MDREGLEKPFGIVEVLVAFLHLGGDATPSLDGFLTMLWSKCLATIRKEEWSLLGNFM